MKTASGLKEQVRKLLPREPREHRILFGRLQGAPIVTSWHDYPGAILGRTERPLLAWFHRNARRSETWIDVGAHYGYTALALSRIVGPSGRVLAFEPVASTAQCLERTRALNGLTQLTVLPVALDSCRERQSVSLPTFRGMADSTLVNSKHDTQAIESISFDALWPMLAGGNLMVHGVKIDVQGMELDVLQGMQETLRRSKPVVAVELHMGVDRQAILSVLAGCGYTTAGEPIETSEVSGSPQYRDDCSYAFRPQP
jgi:FkbM family methyltransferase